MTPTFIKFSPLAGDVLQVIPRLGRALRVIGTHVINYAELRPSDGSGFDGGLELVGEDPEQCDSEEEAIRKARRFQQFGLTYLVRQSAYVFLYFFEVAPGSYKATCEIEGPLISHEDDDGNRGTILWRILTALVTGMNAEVCGFGRDAAYSVRHESLDVPTFVRRLRAGELFGTPDASYHAISTKLISTAEMQRLVRRGNPDNDFPVQYAIVGGHHVFWRLPY